MLPRVLLSWSSAISHHLRIVSDLFSRRKFLHQMLDNQNVWRNHSGQNTNNLQIFTTHFGCIEFTSRFSSCCRVSANFRHISTKGFEKRGQLPQPLQPPSTKAVWGRVSHGDLWSPKWKLIYEEGEMYGDNIWESVEIHWTLWIQQNDQRYWNPIAFISSLEVPQVEKVNMGHEWSVPSTDLYCKGHSHFTWTSPWESLSVQIQLYADVKCLLLLLCVTHMLLHLAHFRNFFGDMFTSMFQASHYEIFLPKAASTKPGQSWVDDLLSLMSQNQET